MALSLAPKNTMHPNFVIGVGMQRHELAGERFGRLIALAYVPGSVKRKAGWRCRCDCGGNTFVITNDLKDGSTISCGCRKLEAARENIAEHMIKPRHGMTGTRTHSTWASMIERCDGDSSKPSHRPYVGVSICDRWRVFENFLADMGERPPAMTLDRVDVAKGYEPGNCRWATNSQQQRNKSTTRYLFVAGVRRPLMDVADEMGIKKTAAQYFFSVLKRFSDAGLLVSVKPP